MACQLGDKKIAYDAVCKRVFVLQVSTTLMAYQLGDKSERIKLCMKIENCVRATSFDNLNVTTESN